MHHYYTHMTHYVTHEASMIFLAVSPKKFHFLAHAFLSLKERYDFLFFYDFSMKKPDQVLPVLLDFVNGWTTHLFNLLLYM